MIAAEAPARAALLELRHARRHNHREAVHWVDAIYRVYVGALVALVVVFAGTAVFGDQQITAEAAHDFAASATPWLGLAFALALAVGLRSGARGGPLTLQSATVQHELLAPIDPGFVLREPALKQVRFFAFVGACVGGVAAMTGVRQLPTNPVIFVGGAALAGAAAAVLALGVAMIFSGRRIPLLIANALALAVLGWSVVDIVAKTATSPMTWLGSLATAAITFNPLALVTLAAAVAVIPVALNGIGGISIDDARRRAGLVSQLRFAVTLQDIRTVVLLRRQLAQETPRAKPWVPLKRGGRAPAVWRRDWRCYFRFPLVRVGRLVVFGFVAGIGLGVTWHGVRPAFLISALALYLAGYDAVEPLAQEIDHPSRWDGMPRDHGILLLTHLPAAFFVMLLVCLIGSASALIMVPASVVLSLSSLLLWVVALAAVAGAALSTVMGAPDMSKMMAGLGADVMGFVMLFRLVFPYAITVAALAPIFRAGVTVDALDLDKAQTVTGYTVLLAGGAIAYVRFQKPTRV